MRSKWSVLFLIWLMMVVAYCDRINLTVAGPKIMAALHIGKPQFGYVLAAFTLGYAFMQAPGGFLADRFGARRVLVAAIVIWSIFTAMTGLAAGLVTMLGIRVLFGIGEGIENGAQFKLIGDYFTPKERAQASGLFLSALALGPAIASPLAARLTATIGWEKMFVAFGAAGLGIAVLLGYLLPESAGTNHPADSGDLGFMARTREAIAIPALRLCALGYLLFNLTYWGLLGWAPTYLSEDRHVLSIETRGWLLSAMYLSGFVGLVVFGRLGSTVFHHRRAGLVAFAYVAAAAALALATTSTTTNVCLVGLSVAAFFLYGSFGPIWAIAVDLAPPESRGLATGWVNFCGQVGGFFGPIAMGVLAGKQHSFGGSLLFLVAALIFAGVVMGMHAVRYPTHQTQSEV